MVQYLETPLWLSILKKLITFEVIDPAIWYTKVKKAYIEWESRLGGIWGIFRNISRCILEELKGIDRDYIEFIAAHVIEVNGMMVYKYSREQIKWHKIRT